MLNLNILQKFKYSQYIDFGIFVLITAVDCSVMEFPLIIFHHKFKFLIKKKCTEIIQDVESYCLAVINVEKHFSKSNPSFRVHK